MTDYRYIRLARPPAPPPTAPHGRLVVAAIGIDQYASWPRLSNAVNDARGAAQAFCDVGFIEVTPPLVDGAATGEAMRRLVTTDLAKLSPDDDLVVFFAGHGHTDVAKFDDVSVKTGYIIPVDAATPEGKDGATWIRLDSWLSDIARLPPRHILVFVDACNSGVALSALAKWRDDGAAPADELEALRARRSRCVITSALDDQRAMDGGPRPGHSLFTGCLIEGLSGGLADGGQTVATGREIGQYLQKRVRSYPHTTQTPDFGAFELDDRGDIIVPILTAGRPAPRPRPPSTENGLGSERERPPARRTWRRWAIAVAAGLIATGARLLICGTGPGRHRAPDVTIDLRPTEIKVAIREPEVLGRPWILPINLPPFEASQDAVDKQRARALASTDPADHLAQTVVLAAMVYGMTGRPGLSGYSASARAQLDGARQQLRGAVAGMKSGVPDELAHRLLATYDVVLGDYPAAARTWRTLVDGLPGSADRALYRACLIYALLAQHQSAEALAAAGEPLDEDHPELAYLTAWARSRDGDRAGAWQAIRVAAARWAPARLSCRKDAEGCKLATDSARNTRFERELARFAGEAGIGIDEAIAALGPDRDDTDDDHYERHRTYEVFAYSGLEPAGRWSDAVAALDRASSIADPAVSEKGPVVTRLYQAMFTVPLDDPYAVARYVQKAGEVLAQCRLSCNEDDRARLGDDLLPIARLYGKLYEGTRDLRYRTAAADVLTTAIPLISRPATLAQAQRDLVRLESGAGRTGDAGAESEALAALIAWHDPEIQTCYALGLDRQPALTGTIAVTLEPDRRGVIARATARVADGTSASAELSSVSDCIAGRARQWTLPAHAVRTRIELHYLLSAVGGH